VSRDLDPPAVAAMLSEEEAVAQGARVGVPEQLARLSIFRLLLRRPAIAKPVADLLLHQVFGGDLDHRLRELVIMRIGWSTCAAYEWTQHWPIARDFGVSEADLLGVRDWRAHPGFGFREQAVLQATDECLDAGGVTQATRSALVQHLTEEELVELFSAISTWTMVSVLVRSLDVPLEDGVAPWPPDGRAPRP
jgi:alkylhydroperoxidase family enzyme